MVNDAKIQRESIFARTRTTRGKKKNKLPLFVVKSKREGNLKCTNMLERASQGDCVMSGLPRRNGSTIHGKQGII